MGTTPETRTTLVLWASDAAVEFVNGCIRGIGAGTGGGVIVGGMSAYSGTHDPQPLSCAAALGFLGFMLSNGMKAVVVWHHANPLPNPLRREAPPVSTNPDGHA